MTDLWPDDIASEKITTPISILKEQADLLSKKTSNILQGVIKSNQYKGGFNFTFRIDVPTLNYSFTLFEVSHSADLYPVLIKPSEGTAKELGAHENILKANSEEEFNECLRKIFSAEKTRNVISILLAQAQA